MDFKIKLIINTKSGWIETKIVKFETGVSTFLSLQILDLFQEYLELSRIPSGKVFFSYLNEGLLSKYERETLQSNKA